MLGFMEKWHQALGLLATPWPFQLQRGGGSTWKIGPSKALSLGVGGKCCLDGNDGNVGKMEKMALILEGWSWKWSEWW